MNLQTLDLSSKHSQELSKYDQMLERSRQYQAEHRAEILEYQKKYREENRERLNKLQREYRNRNLEKCRERARKYYAKNREKMRAGRYAVRSYHVRIDRFKRTRTRESEKVVRIGKFFYHWRHDGKRQLGRHDGHQQRLGG